MADMTTTHGSFDALQRRRKKQSRPAALVPLLLFTTGWAPEGSGCREGLEEAGLFLIVAGVFGRASSPLDIGGRKARQPVTAGPYPPRRNSLSLFAVIAAAERDRDRATVARFLPRSSPCPDVSSLEFDARRYRQTVPDGRAVRCPPSPAPLGCRVLASPS